MRSGQRIVAVNGEYVNEELKNLRDVSKAMENRFYWEQKGIVNLDVIEPEAWTEYLRSKSMRPILGRSKTNIKEILDEIENYNFFPKLLL